MTKVFYYKMAKFTVSLNRLNSELLLIYRHKKDKLTPNKQDKFELYCAPYIIICYWLHTCKWIQVCRIINYGNKINTFSIYLFFALERPDDVILNKILLCDNAFLSVLHLHGHGSPFIWNSVKRYPNHGAMRLCAGENMPHFPIHGCAIH